LLLVASSLHLIIFFLAKMISIFYYFSKGFHTIWR